jgi:hypothetical protein
VPKARLVRPEIWTDAKFVSLSPLARLLFVGMWNFACDNGHVDHNPLELKMRILPADSCDIPDLLDEVLATGMVITKDDYLKIPKLAEKQPLDLRYLQFCDACNSDPNTHYQRSDKKDGRGEHASGTRATREAPASGRGRGGGGVDGDGGGEGAARPARATQLPTDWKPNDKHREFAADNRINLAAEVDQFADHHRAKGSTMKDWDAAFRTWLRNAVKWRKEEPAKPRILTEARDIELPPDGLTDAEYAAWERGQRAKRVGA